MSEKFDVILIDAPWRFRVWSDKKATRRPPYPTMTTEQICALEIPAAENCALFVWATWPMIEHAFKAIDAWGFKYRTLAWIWVKLNKNGLGFFTGSGYYTRANSEPCLLAVRGTMPRQAKDVQAVIVSPVRQHSRKPDEQYPKIERLYPNLRYLEMFARQKRPGWSAWGNEVESDIEITARMPQ